MNILLHFVHLTEANCSASRGGMIQTAEQYQFVHHVLSLYEKQMSYHAEE